MKTFIFLTVLLIGILPINLNAQGAAPSIHLRYVFPMSDAILKMQKVKIVQSANASYFEVNRFLNGYSGLQQTPSTAYGTHNILISSLWDYDTAGGILSSADYNAPTTIISRFGGEGDGTKSINPYNWELNNWYNLVNRAWKEGGRVHVATFIQNVATGKWFHTATISNVESTNYLDGSNDAFLENWDNTNPLWDGSQVRKAFFKDCWNMDINGNWVKNTYATFSANGDQDIPRDGIYHNSFNAYYDTTENAYCMQHGGNTTPSAAFNNGRTLNLPAQSNQGNAPSMPVGSQTSLDVSYNINNRVVTVNWTTDENKSPQLSVKIDIINDLRLIEKSVVVTSPEARSANIDFNMEETRYTIRTTLTDIFNQTATPNSLVYIVGSSTLSNDDVKSLEANLKVSPNPAKDFVNIKGKNLKEASIYDASGKLVKTESFNDDEYKINVQKFSKGIYLMLIKDNKNNVFKRKFIKE